MKGIKGFIVGFSVSLVSVSFAGQLYSVNPQSTPQPKLKQNIEINLFKDTAPIFNNSTADRFAVIKKESLPITEPQVIAENNIDSENDEEILSINIENIIPIDFSETNESNDEIQISNTGTTKDIVALLPEVTNLNENTDSPWVVAKGNKQIKNKKLLEEYTQTSDILNIKSSTSDTFNDDDAVSYKVAERIKQSIIFPIPDEILNDSNITPTFIKRSPKTTEKKQEKPTSSTSAKKSDNKQITTNNATTNKKDDSILNNLSSWFNSDKKDTEQKKEKTNKAPSYSSNNKKSSQTTNKNTTKKHNEDFVSFYKTLQETTREHEQDNAVPQELKLSFQPERAEISGQTLNWIKAFSQKANKSNTSLQIILDSNTQADLQRRRLSLLYTIFMNNKVEAQKVEAALSTIGADNFIIRIIKH